MAEEAHPIVESLMKSLEALEAFEETVKSRDVDGMKSSINEFLASLQRSQHAAIEHPDGQREIPQELFNNMGDWDEASIKEMEAALREDDVLRIKKRHMADLAMLVRAAL